MEYFNGIDDLDFYPILDKNSRIQIRLLFTDVNSLAMDKVPLVFTNVPVMLSTNSSLFEIIINAYYKKIDFTLEEFSPEEEIDQLLEEATIDPTKESVHFDKNSKGIKRKFNSSFFGHTLANQLDEFYGENYSKLEYTFHLRCIPDEFLNILSYQVKLVETKEERQQRCAVHLSKFY